MPPLLASCLCAVFVVCLLVRDVRQNPGVSHALWIPLLWLLIIASRLPTEWFGSIVMSSGAAYEDGSPLDRNVFLALMIVGVLVILRRSVSWGSLTIGNSAITLFFVFTFVSILWSDFPLVAFKRWHKVFGHIIMVLVVLTDREPNLAFTALLKRCGYVLLPLSVLYIKYYPELGRGFDTWTGAAVNTGITTNKNALGNLCLITGPFFLAMLLAGAKGKRFMTGLDRYIGIAFLYMIGWLLMTAQSSTARVSTVLAVSTILGLRSAMIRRHFSALLVTACVVVGLLLTLTNIKDAFIVQLGEDTTLTGRTELWEELQKIPSNSLVGVGFESFWLGNRLDGLWQKYWWRPNQAHNGYYEMYLNLGWIGVIILCSMILAGYRKARRQTLVARPPPDAQAALTLCLAEYRFAFLLGLVAYNMTDATFKALHPSFFLFFLVALEYRPAMVSATVPGRIGVTGDTRQASVGQPGSVAAAPRWTGHAHPARARTVRSS
jgi:exopolysaccharide production protein ExoQ